MWLNGRYTPFRSAGTKEAVQRRAACLGEEREDPPVVPLLVPAAYGDDGYASVQRVEEGREVPGNQQFVEG